MNSHSKTGLNDFKLNTSKVYPAGADGSILSRYIAANMGTLVASKSKAHSKTGTPRNISPEKDGPHHPGEMSNLNFNTIFPSKDET